MKFIWKYFIPLILVLFGIDVMGGNSDAPFSRTIPIALGSFQIPVGAGLILLGSLAGVAIYLGSKGKHGA